MTVQQEAERRTLSRALLSFEQNTSPRLSPDGRSIVFVRTDDNGPELWLRSADGRERRLASHHGETIQDLRWTVDGSTLLYRHAPRGREQWSLSGLRGPRFERVAIPAPGPVIEYWPSRSDPAAVAYSSRVTRSRPADLFLVDLTDLAAEPVRIATNPGFHRWLVDGGLRPRGGTRLVEDGSTEIVLGDDLRTARTVLSVPVDAVPDLAVQGFSRDGERLFLLASGEARTRRLIAIESGDDTISTVFEHDRLDIGGYPIGSDGVWFDPTTGQPDICAVMDQRLRYHPLTERSRGAVASLAATDDHSALILDRSADDGTWLIVYIRDDGPIAYHFYDPVTSTSDPLFVNRPDLTGHTLARLEDFCFTASDGRELSGYAMRPRGQEGPFPTVVLVHGGPASRDYWRFHADAQYLASLGYLSLHVNYRGSKGFGRDFRMAGHGEWGGRMQQDLYDAVRHGVATGLVDVGRVAFFGGSYGGYASLLAACTRPDLVRCAIAISPPCDLVSFTEKPPPYWQPLAVLLRRQVLGGDGPNLDEAALGDRSPMQTLGESCAPVLLVHGVRDPRVPVAEVDRFAARAVELGVPVRYLRFGDEGHLVKSNANRMTLFTEIKAFLEAYLDVH